MDDDLKNIKEKIMDFLSDCSSLVILGIGNDIRGDDGLGPYIIDELCSLKESSLINQRYEFSDKIKLNKSSKEEIFHDNVDDINTGNALLFNDENLKNVQKNDNVNVSTSFDLNNLRLINCGSVPENFTSKIKAYDPSHIIIIDATLMNLNPGDIQIVNRENIVNISVSTHSLLLTYLIKYLEVEKHYNFLFIGIEPEIMDLSFDLSDTVKKASDNLVNILFSAIENS